MHSDVVIKLASSIKWKSIDKDNMEFTATITCYQKDALEEILHDYIDAKANHDPRP